MERWFFWEAVKARVRYQIYVLTVFTLVLRRALTAGLCGVPSFQVDDGHVLWGQDRLNVMEDMLCGWQDPDIHYSKL